MNPITRLFVVPLGIVFCLPVIARADHEDARYRYGNGQYGNEWRGNEGARWRWGDEQRYHDSWGRRPTPYDSHSWSSPAFGFGARENGFGVENAIRDGARRGELSRAELRDLREKQQNLERERSVYWADGRLTERERQDLQNDYRDLEKDLNHNIRDGEKADRDRHW